MIKKQQKWIALLVTLTFVWLMQVSTMPLAAANITEKISSANPEQAPDFVESVGHNSSTAKKKSIMPVILIGVGVVAVAAVLFLVVLNTKYDPVGTWLGPFSNEMQNWTGIVTFSGDKKAGTLKYSDSWSSNLSGTYTVDGKNITFIYIASGQTITNIGKFDGKDSMSGIWKNENNPTFFGNWKMTRGGTAKISVPLNVSGAKGAIKDDK